MKRILLDCDGVLADFMGGVFDLVEKQTGLRHSIDEITEWDFVKAMGLAPDLAKTVKATLSGEPGWWLSLKPFDQAAEAVALLRKMAEVYIVTSPWNSHRNWLHEREAWLKKHFGIPHSHVIACSAKHLVRGDILVDDKTSTLIDWQREHPTARAVRWEQPYNINDEWGGSSTSSWAQLIAWADS